MGNVEFWSAILGAVIGAATNWITARHIFKRQLEKDERLWDQQFRQQKQLLVTQFYNEEKVNKQIILTYLEITVFAIEEYIENTSIVALEQASFDSEMWKILAKANFEKIEYKVITDWFVALRLINNQFTALNAEEFFKNASVEDTIKYLRQCLKIINAEKQKMADVKKILGKYTA